MKSRYRILIDGAVAGIIGALVVAVWFVLFDYSRGQLLNTPALLGDVVLHGGAPGIPRDLMIKQYTVLHFVLFILFGVGAAALVEATRREQSLRIATIVFVIGFEAFALASFFFLGPRLEGQITWWSVAVANLLATACMVGYFAWRHPELGQNLLGDWREVVSEGIVAGLIGAVTVAIWFFIYDFAIGRPLQTPALLGGALLEGNRNPAMINASAAVLVGYSVFHLVAFIIFGVIAAAMLAASEREPVLLLGLLVVFACFEVFFLGFAAAVNQSLLQALGWWMILGGNLVAALAMLAYFRRKHPSLTRRLAARWSQQAGDAAAL